MEKIKAIIIKEWTEAFQNRFVRASQFFIPIMLTVFPIVMIYSTRSMSSEMGDAVPSMFVCPVGASAGTCFQYYIVTQFILFFVIMPSLTPIGISTYSVVGEKSTRSLEPLLASPVTTQEILLGKILSAVLPAVITSYLGFAAYFTAMKLMITDPVATANLINPYWLILVTVAGPLMAILATSLAVLISSRVNEPRTAEQLSTMFILPIVVGIFRFLTELIAMQPVSVFVLIGAFIIADAVMLNILVRFFQRDTILSRWGG